MQNSSKLCIVMPVYNDWLAANLLIKDICAELTKYDLKILLVDDGSSQSPDYSVYPLLGDKSVTIIGLTRNVGHQKAIAIGLSYAGDHFDFDLVIVMDSDGEDRAKDILTLIEKGNNANGGIVFAKRIKRKESLLFRISYQLYRLFFTILVGKKISFGNFSLIPKNQVARVTNTSEIWSNYSAGIIYSRVPYVTVPIERGTRLAGSS